MVVKVLSACEMIAAEKQAKCSFTRPRPSRVLTTKPRYASLTYLGSETGRSSWLLEPTLLLEKLDLSVIVTARICKLSPARSPHHQGRCSGRADPTVGIASRE